MLLQNTTIYSQYPLRFLSGSTISCERILWGQAERRNVFVSEAGWNAKSAIPVGGTPPTVILMAKSSGGMSSHYEADFTISASADGTMGLPAQGSATITITVADAAGQLISSGQGSASFIIDTNHPLLTASIGGTGAASFVLSTNMPILGAEASLTASTTLAFSGSLTPYAVGIMEGTTEVASSVPTADQNASAVWSKFLSNSQTAENTLLSAGSAGDPWIADLDSYGSGTAGKVMALMSKILRNKSVTNPNTGQMTVYDDDGVTPLLVANLYEDSAGATPYRGKGAERRERLE